jgi:hypothetical protein
MASLYYYLIVRGDLVSLATNLRTAARSLITTFGNTGDIYSYSSATKTENEEGDVTVSDWKTASSVPMVDGDNAKEIMVAASQGMETLGDDEKIVRDDTTVTTDDRITIDSVDYKVIELRPLRSQDTTIIKIIRVARVTSTTQW